ncbi:MAG TPA: hypothetical protein VE866_14305 [Candidatus Binatia bacterium]|nr:hypothetical protein [Candidatus Binatia bacterium]
MAKKVGWRHDAYLIREKVQNSRTETWQRDDIERAFRVSRPTAWRLMYAIGGLQRIGKQQLFVSRESILQFLDTVTGADDISETVRDRRESYAPPEKKPIPFSIPPDLQTYTVQELPLGVTLAEGELHFKAQNFDSVMDLVRLFMQAMYFYQDTVREKLDPPVNVEQEDADLRRLRDNLRRRSQERAVQLASAPTAPVQTPPPQPEIAEAQRLISPAPPLFSPAFAAD